MAVPLTVMILMVTVKLDDVCAQTGSTGTGNSDVCQVITCNDNCGTNGHCVELDDCSTACVCNDGFEGNPPICTDIVCNEPCKPNAICVLDSSDNPLCKCADGYLGDGVLCSLLEVFCAFKCGTNEHNSRGNCACVCNDGYRNTTITYQGDGSMPSNMPSIVYPSTEDVVSGRTVAYGPSVSSSGDENNTADFPVITIIAASIGCGVLVLCLACSLIFCATRIRERTTEKAQSPNRTPEEHTARLDEESVYNPSYQRAEHDVTTRDDMTKPDPTDPASFSESIVIKIINPDDRNTHETAVPLTLPRVVHTTSYQKIDSSKDDTSSGANEATVKNGGNTATPGGQKDPIRNTPHQSSASKSHGGRPDANGRTGNEPNSDTGPTEDRYSIVSKSDSQFDGTTVGSSMVDRQADPYTTKEHTQEPIVDEEYSQPKMAKSDNKMAGNDDKMARSGRMAGSGDNLAGNVVNDDATYDTPDGDLITDRVPLAQSPLRIGKDYPYAAIQKKSRRGKQAGDTEAGHVFSMGDDDSESTGNTSEDYEGGVYNVAYDSCDLKTTPKDDGDALTYYYVDEGKDKQHGENKDKRTSSGLYESF